MNILLQILRFLLSNLYHCSFLNSSTSLNLFILNSIKKSFSHPTLQSIFFIIYFPMHSYFTFLPLLLIINSIFHEFNSINLLGILLICYLFALIFLHKMSISLTQTQLINFYQSNIYIIIIYPFLYHPLLFKFKMYQSRVSAYSQQSKIYGLKSLGISGVSSIHSSLPGFTHILCPTHSEYGITNICKSQSCIEPLCPQCIPSHIRLHQQSKKTAKIETIVSARINCIQKLAEQKFYTQTDLQKLENQYKSKVQQIDNNMKQKLKNSKIKLLKFIDKIYQKLYEATDVIYRAYAYQAQKNDAQFKMKITPLNNHLNTVTQFKKQLESDDFISTLIQVLSDFPKRPQISMNKKNENYGSVQINDKMLEQVQKSIEKYIKVIVNCKQQRTNNFSNTNNNKFSRINMERSKSNDSKLSDSSVKKSIFGDKTKKDYGKIQYQNYKVIYESNRQNSVSILQSNYFKSSNGILAYCQQKTKYYFLAKINQVQSGFKKIQINSKILFPQAHRLITTPNNQLYIIGGKIDYQPTNRTFQIKQNMIQELPRMTVQRFNLGACYHNESIYVCGGITCNLSTNKFERYQIKKKVWISLKSCVNSNYNSEISSFNDYIIKIGGRNENQDNLNNIELYNVINDNWIIVPIQLSLLRLPSNSGIIQINSNDILIFGGTINDIKQNQSYKVEFKNQIIKITKSSQLYSASTFSNPSFVNNRNIFCLQNTSKGITKNIIRFDGINWKFISC